MFVLGNILSFFREAMPYFRYLYVILYEVININQF